MALVLQSGIALTGGGDKHNLGWFVDEAALVEAYPVGNDGDYALLGSTDTIWTWDSDTIAWVDTDRKGQVSSVNNETGDVTVQETLVNQQNIKSINGSSILGSGNLEIAAHLNFPSSWPTTNQTTTKAFCDAVAADTSAIEGKMYLGEVYWSDMPNGLVNSECVVEIMKGSTAQNKIIVLTLTSGNRAPYLWKYTYWNGGSNVSGWKGFVPTTNTANKVYGTDANGLQTTYDVDYFGQVKSVNSKVGVVVLDAKDVAAIPQLSVVPEATSENTGTIFQYIGETTNSYVNGYFYKSAMVSALNNAEQVSELPTASAEEVGKVYQYNDTFYTCSSDGKVAAVWGQPAVEQFSWKEVLVDSNLATEISALPHASVEELGNIYLYTGTTSGGYKNGCIYRCVESNVSMPNGDPYYIWQKMETVESSYNWQQVNVQPIVDPLPSQTGQNGKFLTTDGTDVSWATVDALPSQSGQAGKFLTTDGSSASWANIPDPLPSQTGNAGKVLMTNGTTASWVDITTSPATMPQLLAANWSSNTQTVNVTGVTANNVVMVSPSPVSATEYAQCGILCTAQAAGTLTFTCTSVPTNDLTVNVVCF